MVPFSVLVETGDDHRGVDPSSLYLRRNLLHISMTEIVLTLSGGQVGGKVWGVSEPTQSTPKDERSIPESEGWWVKWEEI